MRNAGAALAAIVSLSCILAAHADPIIWDYGPTTGADGGSWQNFAGGQNFAEKIHFNNAVFLTGYEHFAFIFPASPTDAYRLKLLADSAGLPGALLGTWDLSPTSSVLVHGTNYYQDSFVLPGIALAANTTYWIGLSGKDITREQRSVLSPGDGKMAQFAGTTYSLVATIGDQMFQLRGVPEPAIALPLMILLLAARKPRQPFRKMEISSSNHSFALLSPSRFIGFSASVTRLEQI